MKKMSCPFLLLLAILFSICSSAQVAKDNVNAKVGREKLYGLNYHKPQFIGGSEKLKDYFNKNLHYPQLARENNIAGWVVVRFFINEDGSLSDFTLLRGIGGGCDEEAMRAVKEMPNWAAAIYKGKKIKVVEELPVLFQLE